MSVQLTGELQSLLTGAGFAPVQRGFLQISGPDATRWLNGMVSNSIQALNPGEGTYNFLLNAQGRIQGDGTIYRDPGAGEPAYLLETDIDQLEPIQLLLDRFIIMDDVELLPLSQRATTLILGATSPAIIETAEARIAGGALFAAAPPLHLARPSAAWEVTTPYPGLVPRYHVTTPGDPQVNHFLEALNDVGALKVSPSALEALRILEARPRYGIDIRNSETAKDLPQETNQPQALHFAKGCYVGQEIVERIRSRGQVHRLLVPLALTGQPSSLPAPLEAGGKSAGEITSAACVQTTEGERWIGMGYVRREALALVTPLLYLGGKASTRQAGCLDQTENLPPTANA